MTGRCRSDTRSRRAGDTATRHCPSAPDKPGQPEPLGYTFGTFEYFYRNLPGFIRCFRDTSRISCSMAGPCVRLRNNAFHCTNHPLFRVVRQGAGEGVGREKRMGNRACCLFFHMPPKAAFFNYPQAVLVKFIIVLPQCPVEKKCRPVHAGSGRHVDLSTGVLAPVLC